MYQYLLCWRYLRTRWIALASVVSVTLGVATLIVVNSVMAGFATEMRERINGILADVVIESGSLDGFPDPQRHMDMVRQAVGDKVAAMTPTIEVFGMLSFQFMGEWITRPVTVVGIEPEGKASVGDYAEHLLDPRNQEHPSFELSEEAMEYRRRRMARRVGVEFRDPGSGTANDQTRIPSPQRREPRLPDPFEVMVEPADAAAPQPLRMVPGYLLVTFSHVGPNGTRRDVLMVQPGEDVRLTVPNAGRPPQPVHASATVVDLFQSTMSEYDVNLVFVPLEALQRLRGMIDPETGIGHVTAIQIKLKDYADAPEVVAKLKELFPPPSYGVFTWEQKQGPLLAAVSIERGILNVLLFLIIAVAGFGILAIFFMIVVEKTRDIGILKALGASSHGVMGIFLSYGLSLGLVGSGIGMVLGLLFVHYINEIEWLVSLLTGHKVFDERIYYFPAIPTLVNPLTVAWIVVGAMLIAVLASVLPARRAARLHPVEALRYE